MGFLIILGACIAGLVIGASGNDTDLALGFFGGLAIGIAYVRLGALRQRLDALQRELHTLRSTTASRLRAGADAATTPMPDPAAAATPPAPAPGATPAIAPAPPAATSDTPTIIAPPPPLPPLPPLPPRAARPAAPPLPVPATVATTVAAPAVRRSEPDWFDRAGSTIRRWFSEGNVPVKIGMLVLFAGVAALLKYAADQGWLRVPIELRLSGIAAAAMAAIAFGWRVRNARRPFALSLQGGAIGILLLTVFAAFRLYPLLPASAAFALLIVLVAGAGMLAVLQDALALAVLGLLAGFAAPILIATGGGDHVALFAYYLVLNLAILAIARYKSWRVLNLLGFLFTFAIGTAWGVLRYERPLLASTEPFLLAFFAIYLAVPILYGARRSATQRDLVDGTLVFGNPLFAFSLQAALLQGERMPLALIALAAAALYLLLAWWQRPRQRLLGDAFAVLAVGFATLAVPLALSARATASTFALEGAALIWLGLRQQRRLPQIAGTVLQALAACAFVAGALLQFEPHERALANPTCVSALLLALAGCTSAWLYLRAGGNRRALLFYLWGLLWWCAAALREIDRFVPPREHGAALLAWLTVSAALAALATRRLRASATAMTVTAACIASIGVALWFGVSQVQPFAGWGLAALTLFAVGGGYALTVLGQREDRTAAVAHCGWVWSWVLFTGFALHRVALGANLGSGWDLALFVTPLLAAWALALLRPRWLGVPLSARIAQWRSALLLQLGLLACCLFALTLWHDGASTPLPWLPLLNPVELVQLATLALLARWLGDAELAASAAPLRAPLLAGAGFAFITAATLRATHQLGGVPWDDQLWNSNPAQMALTLVWSVLGVIGWIVGSRRGQRALWLAAAILMAVVLAKLMLVDRERLGNLFGIASFIAYGLLCTIVGYFAPAPPRALAAEKST